MWRNNLLDKLDELLLQTINFKLAWHENGVGAVKWGGLAINGQAGSIGQWDHAWSNNISWVRGGKIQWNYNSFKAPMPEINGNIRINNIYPFRSHHFQAQDFFFSTLVLIPGLGTLSGTSKVSKLLQEGRPRLFFLLEKR